MSSIARYYLPRVHAVMLSETAAIYARGSAVIAYNVHGVVIIGAFESMITAAQR